jgi:hypothetical protein
MNQYVPGTQLQKYKILVKVEEAIKYALCKHYCPFVDFHRITTEPCSKLAKIISTMHITRSLLPCN